MKQTLLPGHEDKHTRDDYKLDADQVDILWHTRFYDGPRAGVAVYDKRHCWFEMVEENHRFDQRTDGNGDLWIDWYVKFILIELSDEQFANERKMHQLFLEIFGINQRQKCIGEQDDFVLSESQKNYLYEVENRQPQDYSNNHIIGWFELLWSSAEASE